MRTPGLVPVICALALGASGAGADEPLWRPVAEASAGRPAPERVLPTGRYGVFALDRDALGAILDAAPLEFTDAAERERTLLLLPLPDGRLSLFRIEASPILAPELQAQFPEIRTLRGQGLTDRTASVRFDLTPRGFHAMILSGEGTVFVDPYGPDDIDHYVSYFKRDYERAGGSPFRCLVHDVSPQDARGDVVGALPNGGTLRQYRLALAATTEYTTTVCSPNPPGVACGLAAMTTTMNRVNGVYERDLAVRMNLIANENLIIYTSEPDPYTNNNGVTMLGQNQANLDSVIGSANYDIGHVFSTGGGGIAGLGVVCVNGSKARGVTGLPNPVGDPFDIDFVAHEQGHQFSGNHTFNGTTSNCGGGNRNPATAWEPGSGSTIMAYAGICGAEDLQLHSDDYFHVGNLDEMTNFIQTGSGSTCSANSATGNTPPTVSAGADVAIPRSTPFTLTASGSDPNGDTLTFDWEEFDLGAAAPPNTDNGDRPIFRSFNPTAGPARTFPRLQFILNNDNTPPASPVSESLPTFTRSMSFRVTARDNRSGGGGVNADLMLVNVTSAAGPFKVTQPDTAIVWNGGTAQTVTWNVAGTNVPPVSCAAVNIQLSTDGGNTFPTTLAPGTPNDGSEVVTAPNTSTVTARVRVECATSPFFDISNANFTIVAGTSSLSVSDAVPVFEGNSGTTGSGFTISLTPASGGTVTVRADTADGTATLADNDYVQVLNQTVTFNPGETAKVVTVSIVGDLQVELNETFSLNLSNPSGATIADGTGVGTILNDDFSTSGSRGDLVHDSRETFDLASSSGQPRARVWTINQEPYRSYEVIVDGITGDVGGSGLLLHRLDSDGSTVLQSGVPVSGGSALSLRFKNSTGSPNGAQLIRVGSPGCTALCGPNDTLRLRAYETTYRVSRFNNSATQVTVLVIANTTNQPVTGTAAFFRASDGVHLADVPFSLGPRATFVTNTSGVPGLAGAAGGILITNDAAFGALTGKAVAVEPASGFTFDTAMVPRTASTKMMPRDN